MDEDKEKEEMQELHVEIRELHECLGEFPLEGDDTTAIICCTVIVIGFILGCAYAFRKKIFKNKPN